MNEFVSVINSASFEALKKVNEYHFADVRKMVTLGSDATLKGLYVGKEESHD
jgi:hypothetical protein